MFPYEISVGYFLIKALSLCAGCGLNVFNVSYLVVRNSIVVYKNTLIHLIEIINILFIRNLNNSIEKLIWYYSSFMF